jgi:hypothetical protein
MRGTNSSNDVHHPWSTGSSDKLICEQVVLVAVQQCRTMEDFVAVYESQQSFQTILGRMRRSCHDAITAQLHNNNSNSHQNHRRVDQWAQDWAVRMRHHALHGVDIDLKIYRKAVLNLLFALCDAWQDKVNASVTSERIATNFHGHRGGEHTTVAGVATGPVCPVFVRHAVP